MTMMMMSKHPIWQIGLFNKVSENAAECIECKENRAGKYEYKLSDGSTKSLIVHLNSRHKDSEFSAQYNRLMKTRPKSGAAQQQFDGMERTRKSGKREADGEFIQIVRHFPELYDHSHRHYKNNVRKTSIWEDIAGRTGYPDGKRASSRWRSIRDSFRKSIIKHPQYAGGDEAESSTYVYATELNFLTPFLQLELEEGGPSASIHIREGDLLDPVKLEIDEDIFRTCGMDDADSICNGDPSSTLETGFEWEDDTLTRKRKFTSGEEETGGLLNYVDVATTPKVQLEKRQRHQNVESAAAEDDNDGYCRTLANFMRDLDKRRNIEFRLRIEQLKLEFME